jgi:polysaccharide export outer membrane protein
MQQTIEVVKRTLILSLCTAFFFAATGCHTAPKKSEATYNEPPPNTNTVAGSTETNSMATNVVDVTTNRGHYETVILREGDVVKLVFPNTPNLNGNHTIDREGNFNLETVGQIKAAGKTIPELKDAVLAAAANKIDTKEVTVELVTGTFPVFVTGAVFRPGKVMSDHPITALEACMECGGFDYTRANLKTVKISRLENGRYHSFRVNLRDVLAGRSGEPFYLKPQDIIYVQEKFTWF